MIKYATFTVSFLVNTLVFANQPPVDPLHLNWRDTTISPSENFYAYANANWQKQNPIPPEYGSWGLFNVMNENIRDIIHQMLIKASQNTQAKPGSIEQKIGDFYYSGMDETQINKLGLAPLKPEFDKIESIQNINDLQNSIAHLQGIGVDAVFNFGSMQDFEDSNQMIAVAIQGGLGLPRDYYDAPNPKFKKIREQYVQHIAAMFVLSGIEANKASQMANQIMNIETLLAKSSLTNIQMRDPKATYHMMNLQDIEKITPHFSWDKYLENRKQTQVKTLNFATPEFFKTFNNLLETIPLEQWKAYLKWHLLDAYAAYLSQPFVDQNFKMVQTLTGAEKLLPRWKRVVSTESSALGYAIGKMYVKDYFPKESKEQVAFIISSMKNVLKNEIHNLDWMTEKTRKEALKKLELMQERIGYPDKWWDYSSLRIDRGPYVLNVLRANQFLTQRDLNKINKPVDKEEWAMTPQTVNAYYDPSMNNINLPAAILQPPLFDPKAPLAVNFGGIGFIIGHELTHGFDDEGSKFDGEGNLKNWWTPQDRESFEKATNCIVEQYSKYIVDGDLPLKGKLVVGEATADLGGITLAYKAFQQTKEYKTAPTIEGLTPDQQFFLSTAHVWANNIRNEQLRTMQATDPHPPGIYRVNGSLANMPAFYQAFGIQSGPMMNAKICKVW